METITITFNESPVNFPLTIENSSLVKVGEKVVIETPRGLEIGKVVALSFNKKEENSFRFDTQSFWLFEKQLLCLANHSWRIFFSPFWMI